MPEPDQEFQLPEDPGERIAWMKNFAEKLPQHAEKLGIPPEMVAQARADYEAARVEKEKEDAARLRQMEQKLSAVPDGWPPPPALSALMKRVPFIEEPERTRMLKEAECWAGAIVRAGTPRLVPMVRGGWWERGVVLEFTLPEPCTWARICYRAKGKAVWRLLCIVGGRYYLFTDPESQEEETEKMAGTYEFVVLGMLADENPQKGWSHEFGAPSEVLTLALPTEYPVSEALWLDSVKRG